ncbi:MAG: competence ComEA-like helix-hairpin-helix protein [Rhodothermales bacterium]|jgi:competence ComEA-like helix-hairpin-helix protein
MASVRMIALRSELMPERYGLFLPLRPRPAGLYSIVDIYDAKRILYRLEVHLGVTQSEFRGLMVLAALLAMGIWVREWGLQIPAVDQATYDRIEAEFRERAQWRPEPERIGPEPWTPPIKSSTPQPAGGLLDLNTASSDDLQELPRIGPQLATRILDHRKRYGPFRSATDLLMIQGIGQTTLQGLLPLITADPLPEGPAPRPTSTKPDSVNVQTDS